MLWNDERGCAIDRIDDRVVHLFALVEEGLAAATHAYLCGDLTTVRLVAERERLIDSLYRDAETLGRQHIVAAATTEADLQYLLCVLRIVPELERSGDLASHIAGRAAPAVVSELTPRIRGILERMGDIGADMWRTAADAYLDRDPSAAAALSGRDDVMDRLHNELMGELANGAVSAPLIVELTLVGRFYERLGDHAVHVAERIRDLATLRV